MEEFQLSKFTKEGAELLRGVTEEFNRLGIDASRLPKTFPDDGGKIKLVFVGQYSAGKSSIIKMLTGEDVSIGAAITTQNFTPYDWNGLEIIDTPGIHTELRPDHDEITYEQINHAALLIFVITNEGFSQRMGDHFRTLAIKQKRAANMILVVNKMDRTAMGNVPEQQEVIYEDLKCVTTPYDPKDLYLSFLDTTAYFDTLGEDDAELKAELFELSGHDTFVDNLNRFVAAGALLAEQGAQFAAQFIMPAITPLGNFVGNMVNVGTRIALDGQLGIFQGFSGFIANQAGNLVKSLPFFQAKVTLTSRIASFVAANARLLCAGLAVVGVVVSAYMTYRDGEQAEEREKERRKISDNIEKNFSQAADNIGEQMLGSVNRWLKESIEPVIAETFDKKIKAVESQTAKEKLKSTKLSELLTRTENLIGEIQACK